VSKYKTFFLLLALGLIELKVLFNSDTLLTWSTSQEKVGSVLQKSQQIFKRSPGDLNWFALQNEDALYKSNEVIVRGFGQAHLKIGSATVFVPEENGMVGVVSNRRVKLIQGSMWVFTNGSDDFEILWESKVVTVQPSSQVYLDQNGRLHILQGSAHFEVTSLARGEYLLTQDNPPERKKIAVMLLRPQPVEDFYFWADDHQASYFSLPLRGAVITNGEAFDGTWVLDLVDSNGNKSQIQGQGQQMSQNFNVLPGRYQLRIILSSGQKSPLYVVRIHALMSPQLVYPQHKKFLLPLEKKTQVFFLWRGDPAVNFYEISVNSEVYPVSYPLAWVPILNTEKNEWVLNGKIRASHPQAGWSKPFHFKYQVSAIP